MILSFIRHVQIDEVEKIKCRILFYLLIILNKCFELFLTLVFFLLTLFKMIAKPRCNYNIFFFFRKGDAAAVINTRKYNAYKLCN